ncbi:unnamed protein product [Brassicogethes aeneus]|uniref:Uncharacterized protein n=1 Tax=Brassicogethes aeneus TaxID=1431903 RepID=A0A9P0AVJ0_BRAAE|nr:unnamed protein product [Brassicogethes aeneus]
MDGLNSVKNRGERDEDRVGVVFTNAEFPYRPLAISIRKRSQITASLILVTLGKVLQSNASFFTNNRPTLSIDRVQLPVGRGRTALKGDTYEQFCKNKRGIVVVTDNHCLAYALPLVWVSLIRNTRKSSVVEDNTHQPKTLKTLCREVINTKINTCEVVEAKLSETVVNEVFQNRVQDFAMSFNLDDSVLFRNIFGPITDFWGEEALRRFWGFRSDGVMIESIFGSLLPAAEQFCVTDKFYHTTYGRVCEQCVQQNCLKRVPEFRIKIKFGVVADGVHNPKTLKSLARQVLNEKCSVEDIAKVELPRTLVQNIFRNRMLDFILGFPLVATFLLRDLFGPITDQWREDAVKCFWGYRDNRVEIQRIIISILPNDLDFCVHYKYYDTSLGRIYDLCMRKECIRKFADFHVKEHAFRQVEELVDIFLHPQSWCVSCTRGLLFYNGLLSSKCSVLLNGLHNPKTLKSLARQVLNEKCSVEEIVKVELPRTLVQDIFRNRMLDFILGFPLVASLLLLDLFGPITDYWREEAVKSFWGYRDNRVVIQRIILSILPNSMDFCVHYKYYDTSLGRICDLCMRKECIRKFADFQMNEYVKEHAFRQVEELVDIFLHLQSWCVSCTRGPLFYNGCK